MSAVVGEDDGGGEVGERRERTMMGMDVYSEIGIWCQNQLVINYIILTLTNTPGLLYV